MTKKVFNEIFAYIATAFIVWCCIMLIKKEYYIQNEIYEAVKRCLNVIIPSLFALMALSGIIISSKIYTYISKPFYPVSKYILGIPNQLFFIFLLGNISGYPIGAKLIKQLTEEHKINQKTAEILNCFCFSGGPAFFTGVIGLTVFNNSKIGIIIFISVVTANTILAIILNHIFKPKYTEAAEKVCITSDCIIDSVISAGKSMFIICVTIVFFSAIMALAESNGFFDIFKSLGLSQNQCILIKSIFEVSYLSQLSGTPYSLIPFISAICSFGGICVLTQIKAIVGKVYSLKYFLAARIISSALSWLICTIIMKFYKPEIITAASVNVKIVTQENNIIPSLCLIAMIIIITIHKKATHN